MILTTVMGLRADADPFMTVDGEVVTHVKHCLFHHQVYESHFSPDTVCSFNVNNPPPGEEYHETAASARRLVDIPHDETCFGEENYEL